MLFYAYACCVLLAGICEEFFWNWSYKLMENIAQNLLSQQALTRQNMDSARYDGSFQSLLLSEDTPLEFTGDDQFLEEVNATAGVVMPPRERKSQRSKNFTREEDLLIVSAYLNTTKVPIIGNNQQSTTFWGRICKNIENNGGTSFPRTQLSIKARWNDINKKCAKFVGSLSKIERLNQSGQTEQGRITEAHQLYASEEGKCFPYQHCWEILRDDPKWQSTLPNKKARQLPEVNMDVPIEQVGHPSPIAYEGRPIGRKAAKELRKTSRSEGNSVSSVNSSVFTEEYWAKKEEMEKAKVERQERALRQHEKQLEIEEMKAEIEIMSKDTTTMDPSSAAYYPTMKMQILKKCGISDESNY